MLSTAELDTPVGRLRLTVSDAGLRRVRWVDPAGDPQRGDARTAPVAARLAEYFDGRVTSFDLPLDLVGLSDSQDAVLRALHDTVGYGETVTYGELAERSGTGVPARGIGALMGSNPVPLVVPCHRVLAADGLGGYSGGYRDARHGRDDGLEVKRWLLTHEGALQPTLFG